MQSTRSTERTNSYNAGQKESRRQTLDRADLVSRSSSESTSCCCCCLSCSRRRRLSSRLASSFTSLSASFSTGCCLLSENSISSSSSSSLESGAYSGLSSTPVTCSYLTISTVYHTCSNISFEQQWYSFCQVQKWVSLTTPTIFYLHTKFQLEIYCRT